MLEKFFSDEELVAYLDGEQDFAPISEIEAALKTDTALAGRIQQLKIDHSSIKNSFSGVAPTKQPEFEFLQVSANDNNDTPWKLAVSVAVVCMALGFAISSAFYHPAPPGWKEYVAAYQALYTNSTLSHVSQTEEAIVTELKRVSSAIGKDIKPSQLNVSEEVEYKRGQILGFEGTALIQLAFLTSMGEPMALCILRTGNKDSASATIGEMEGMSSAHWSAGGYSYLLIGGKDKALVGRLAEKYIAAKI